MRMANNPSLWWKLSWQLSLVLVTVVAVVIVGLCVYGATVLSPYVAMEDKVGAAMTEAVARDPHAHLRPE